LDSVSETEECAALLRELEGRMRLVQTAYGVADISYTPMEEEEVVERGVTELDDEEEVAPVAISAAAAAGDGEKRLWPSIEARQHWQAYVKGASSFAQLGVACATLRDHAAAYGLLGKKAEKDKEVRRRVEQVWDEPCW
jgi:hypothetical protein